MEMLKRLKTQFGMSHTLHRSGSRVEMRRTSSEQLVIREPPEPTTQPADETVVPYRRNRASTFTNGVSRKSPSLSKKKTSNEIPREEKIMEQLNHLTSPRHFKRRSALVEEDIGLPLYKQNALHMRLEDGGTKIEDTVLVTHAHSLGDIVEMLLIKNDHNLSHESLDNYTLTVSFQDSPVEGVTFDQPSNMFPGHTVEVQPKEGVVSENNHQTAVRVHSQPSQEFNTVNDCLTYFSNHGLVELPLPHGEEPDTFHLPRVQPIDPIVSEWSSLPIDPEKIEALTGKEKEQQLAVWEFIYTEHSHIRQLETVINVFMRCLELIRRTKLLSEDNYHNVFGYMEDIYNAHDQFWTWTLEPALEKVYETGLPLDLNEIISRFPEFGAHFEIYEQHCQLEALNLHSLKRAKENPDFTAYLEWCESQPECHRLGLDQFLAIPMQRLTRYPLLISAIIKKTTDNHLKQRLAHLCEEMQEFVQGVNSGIRIQEETERVRDAMSRITGFQVFDVPSELKDLVHLYTHLDLLAPMAGVEVDRARVLMLEGALKYRDSTMSKMVPLHLFLFTDMLLVTKLSSRKGGDKYTIIKEPYKIDRLVLQSLEPGSFCAVVLNEFRVASSWFILKANSHKVASQWMDQITKAQHFYAEAVERRTQQWKLLQSLQNERTLNGIERIESLSASLWSISSGPRNSGVASSSENLLLKRTSSPTINLCRHKPLIRTRSEDQAKRFGQSVQSDIRQVFMNDVPPKYAFMHTKSPSLDRLLELPEVPPKHKAANASPVRMAASQICLSTFKQSSEESLTASLQQIPASPLSEDSGTESGGTISADGLSDRSEKSTSMYRASSDSTQEKSSPKPPITSARSQSRGCLKPILRTTSSNLDRAYSDDSGIAVKLQTVSNLKESLSSLGIRDGQQFPSDIPNSSGRASIPGHILSHSKTKVHFGSEPDLTPTTPVNEIKIEDIDELIPSNSPTSLAASSPADLTPSEDVPLECVQVNTCSNTHPDKSADSLNSSKPKGSDRASMPTYIYSHSKNNRVHFRSQSDSIPTTPVNEIKIEDIGKLILSNSPTSSAAPPPTILTPSEDVPVECDQVNTCSNTHPDKSADFSKPKGNPSPDSKTGTTTKHSDRCTKVPPPIPNKPLRKLSAAKSMATPPKARGEKKNISTSTGPKKSKSERSEQLKAPLGRKKSMIGDDQPAKKPSHLRKPAIGIKEPRSHVSELREKFEASEKNETVSSASRVRKNSHPPNSSSLKTPASSHSRSKSAVAVSDQSGFNRNGAGRVKTGISKGKASRRNSNKPSMASQVKLSSSVTRSVSTKTPKKCSLKSTRTSSLDETKSEPHQDITDRVSATTPQSDPSKKSTKLPVSSRRLPGLHSVSDTRIGIQLDGKSERGIDVPLNLNSNNNALECSKSEERVRKPSTYAILDAVTVKDENSVKSASVSHRKLNPIEWGQFGVTWKQPSPWPHTLTSLSTNTTGSGSKYLVQQHS